MLGIFGFYDFKNDRKTVSGRLCELFSVKSIFKEPVIFTQGRLSLVYETFKVKETKNFYCVDNDNKTACFIVGNIYAHEESSLKVLTGQDIAKLVIDRYRKGNLEGFVKCLRGVFNIVLVDKHSVFLINDNLGLSPLYVYPTDAGVLFCNEPEAIMRFNGNNRIDYNALAEFMVYGFVPNGRTFIDGLCNQEPGTIVKIINKKITKTKYFSFKPVDISTLSGSKKIQAVRDLFSEAVRIRVPSNNSKVISDLSGGWDSRLILANLLSLKKDVSVFTDASKREDLEIARRIVKQKKLDHIVFDVKMLMDSQPRRFLDITHKKVQIENLITQYNLTDHSIVISPRFTGLFGGELFGNTPAWFDDRAKLNFLDCSRQMFSA